MDFRLTLLLIAMVMNHAASVFINTGQAARIKELETRVTILERN